MHTRRPPQRAAAFTLVEIMLTVAIVAILAIMSMGAYAKYIARTDNLVCIGRMKDVGTGLGAYLISKQEWPQFPETLDNAEESRVWEWWITTLQPYGVAQSAWLCPSDERERKQSVKEKSLERDKYESTYVPTHFDSNPDTPFRWRQPWLLERSAYHPNGQNILMPDGSIQSFIPPTAQTQPKK